MSGGDSIQFFKNVKGSAIVNIATNVELNNGMFISFVNNTGKKFSVQVSEINTFLKIFRENNSEIASAITNHELSVSTGSPWIYQEKPYRSLAEKFFPLNPFSTINPLIGSQTNGVYSAVNSYICFILNRKVDPSKFEFDPDTLESVNSVLQQHAGSFEQKIGTSTKTNNHILGPFDSAKTAALGSLHYCFQNNRSAFLKSIVVDDYKAAVKLPGVYLWASQQGLDEEKADPRVFHDEPFEFEGIPYFLSDQWTIESANGRSIKSLNYFLTLFNCQITKELDRFFLTQISPFIPTALPKPFLLLAGISGTGKTRFVREQANASAALYSMNEGDNYCLVPVRPDWHEPSDLLGYISRIGCDGPRYVVTDVLRFIVAAWKYVALSATATQIDYKDLDSVSPFWLCLDEMNLAPVEQYFADYLSILETRNWENGTYSCEQLLKSTVIEKLDEQGRNDLWDNLKIAGDDPLSVGLRQYFSTTGIPLPPNLIVAGTVNMDETTHGFSRKVIDRALTIDFGEFFPNDYSQFYLGDKKIADRPLNFPRLSKVQHESDLSAVAADPDGRKTIGFLSAVNSTLAATPFALAYRALNEALLSVVCFNPADDTELQAVWDDYLMMKVLPRIEGDAEKLSVNGEESLLTRLSKVLESELALVWLGKTRPDLLRKSISGPDEPVVCRSRIKLNWMQKRLADNSFTTFWP
jgi:hypothetical protein